MNRTNGSDNEVLPPEWLTSPVTLAEIEGPNRALDLVKPADSAEWRAFKSRLEPGDELWYFTSPVRSFGQSAGRMGYVIVRKGQQVAHINVLMC